MGEYVADKPTTQRSPSPAEPPTAVVPPSFLDANDWMAPLRQFSQATGTTVSLYLPDGTRLCGPQTAIPFGRALIDAGAFREDTGAAARFERAQVGEAVRVLRPVRSRPFEVLELACLPLTVEHRLAGIMTIGWTFPDFPDPLACDRIAKEVGVSGLALWDIARQQVPVGRDKFEVYLQLLDTMAGALIEKLLLVEEYRAASNAKDELLAVVSHELKTPLTPILLSLQSLSRGKVTPERTQQMYRQMENGTRSLVKLVDDLLDASRTISGKLHLDFAACDLASIVRECIVLLEPVAQLKGIAFHTRGLDLEFPFVGDRYRLQQLFSNLLGNAIKFSREQGRIWVDVDRFGPEIRVRVTDEGYGIEPEFLPRVFERFSQSSSVIGAAKNKGLGLGLALAKFIAEVHSGTIRVASAGRDRGAAFEVTFRPTLA